MMWVLQVASLVLTLSVCRGEETEKWSKPAADRRQGEWVPLAGPCLNCPVPQASALASVLTPPNPGRLPLQGLPPHESQAFEPPRQDKFLPQLVQPQPFLQHPQYIGRPQFGPQFVAPNPLADPNFHLMQQLFQGRPPQGLVQSVPFFPRPVEPQIENLVRPEASPRPHHPPAYTNSSKLEDKEREEVQILYVPVETLKQRGRTAAKENAFDQTKYATTPQTVQTTTEKFRHPIQPLKDQVPASQVKQYESQSVLPLRSYRPNEDNSPLHSINNQEYVTPSSTRQKGSTPQSVRHSPTRQSYQTPKSIPLQDKPEHQDAGLRQSYAQPAVQQPLPPNFDLDSPAYYDQRTTQPFQEPLPTLPPPNQPPLSVYMETDKYTKVGDVLTLLKGSKTIPVLDTIGPDSPQVFVGPSNLNPPEGYVKFELPYLSSLDGNRIERRVESLPFFVAPLNFQPPPGYSKIPFPSPHIGSVVVSNATTLNTLLSHSETPQEESDVSSVTYRDSYTIPMDISPISPQLPSLVNSLQEDKYTPSSTTLPVTTTTEAPTTWTTRTFTRRPHYRGSQRGYTTTTSTEATRRPHSRQRRPYSGRTNPSRKTTYYPELETTTTQKAVRENQYLQEVEPERYTPQKEVAQPVQAYNKESEQEYSQNQQVNQFTANNFQTGFKNQQGTRQKFEEEAIPYTQTRQPHLGHQGENQFINPLNLDPASYSPTPETDNTRDSIANYQTTTENNIRQNTPASYSGVREDIPVQHYREPSTRQRFREPQRQHGESHNQHGAVETTRQNEHHTHRGNVNEPHRHHGDFNDQHRHQGEVNEQHRHHEVNEQHRHHEVNEQHRHHGEVNEQHRHHGEVNEQHRQPSVGDEQHSLRGVVNEPHRYQTNAPEKPEEYRGQTDGLDYYVKPSDVGPTRHTADVQQPDISASPTYPSDPVVNYKETTDYDQRKQINDELGTRTRFSNQENLHPQHNYDNIRLEEETGRPSSEAEPHRNHQRQQFVQHVSSQVNFQPNDETPNNRYKEVEYQQTLAPFNEGITEHSPQFVSTTGYTTVETTKPPAVEDTYSGQRLTNQRVNRFRSRGRTNNERRTQHSETVSPHFESEHSGTTAEYRPQEVSTERTTPKPVLVRVRGRVRGRTRAQPRQTTTTEAPNYPTIPPRANYKPRNDYRQDRDETYRSQFTTVQSQPGTEYESNQGNYVSEIPRATYEEPHTTAVPSTERPASKKHNFRVHRRPVRPTTSTTSTTSTTPPPGGKYLIRTRRPNQAQTRLSTGRGRIRRPTTSTTTTSTTTTTTESPVDYRDWPTRSDYVLPFVPSAPTNEVPQPVFKTSDGNRFVQTVTRVTPTESREPVVRGYQQEDDFPVVYRQKPQVEYEPSTEIPEVPSRQSNHRESYSQPKSRKQNYETQKRKQEIARQKEAEDFWNQAVTIQQSKSYVYTPEDLAATTPQSPSRGSSPQPNFDYDDYFNYQESAHYSSSDQSPFPSNEQKITYPGLKPGYETGKANQYPEKDQDSSGPTDDPNKVTSGKEESPDDETTPKQVSTTSETNEEPRFDLSSREEENATPAIPVVETTEKYQEEVPKHTKFVDPVTVKKTGRRRGSWVRVRVKKPKDVFQTAESQSFGSVSSNAIQPDGKPVKEKPDWDLPANHKPEKSPSENVTEPSTTTTQETTTLFTTEEPTTEGYETTLTNAATETGVNQTPESTTINSLVEEYQYSSTTTEEGQTLSTLANETPSSKILGTSTTTEISLETEICYRGRCVKTKRTKGTDSSDLMSVE